MTWICFWVLRSEKTKIGSMVSAALVSTLVGLAASNIDIIPYEARAYSIIMEFMLPLTVPLLLFRADLHRVIRSIGALLLALWLGLGIVLNIIKLLRVGILLNLFLVVALLMLKINLFCFLNCFTTTFDHFKICFVQIIKIYGKKKLKEFCICCLCSITECIKGGKQMLVYVLSNT